MSDKKKLRKIEIPLLKIKGRKYITIFQLGDLDRGIIPTEADFAAFRKALKEATKKKRSSLLLPAGFVKVTQVLL